MSKTLTNEGDAMTTLEEIWGPDTEPPRQEWPPLAVHCPRCQAYLMTLGLVGPMECELCGGAFDIPATPTSPFAGIGSEGFEAIKARRRFYGTELKPEYFAAMLKNLQRAKEQCETEQKFLFGATA